MHERLRAAALVAFLSGAALARAEQHVTSGPELDYQPSVIQSTADATSSTSGGGSMMRKARRFLQ